MARKFLLPVSANLVVGTVVATSKYDFNSSTVNAVAGVSTPGFFMKRSGSRATRMAASEHSLPVNSYPGSLALAMKDGIL